MATHRTLAQFLRASPVWLALALVGFCRCAGDPPAANGGGPAGDAAAANSRTEFAVADAGAEPDTVAADTAPDSAAATDSQTVADTPSELPTFVPKPDAALAAGEATGAPDEVATDGALAGPDAPAQDAPGVDAAPADTKPALAMPMAQLDNLALVLVVGDSVGAGYNAAGGNSAGGQGFARLLYQNHAAWPKYNGHDLKTLHPTAQFTSLAKSGATSGEALAALKSALGGSLPKSVAGSVLLVVHVGGNDFNDDSKVMVSTSATAAMAQKLRTNVGQMVQLVRQKYEVLPAKHVVAVVNAVHDPTDGKGSIPPGFTAGLCKALSNPALPLVKDAVLQNLASVNAALQAEALAQQALYVDLHAAFLGHGVNSGAACWIDKDCVHPLNAGHDLIRRKVWLALSGVEFP